MLRIATLTVLALAVPTFAQAKRDGPGNIERKLNQILERIERLEVRVEHAEKRDRPEARPDGDRRGPDRRRGPDARGRRGNRGPDMRGRNSDRRGPQAQGPQRRGPQMGDQPFGRMPDIIRAARHGDPKAIQMLTRVRSAIDDALRAGGGQAGPGQRGPGMGPRMGPGTGRGGAGGPGMGRRGPGGPGGPGMRAGGGGPAAGPGANVRTFRFAPEMKFQVEREEIMKKVEAFRKAQGQSDAKVKAKKVRKQADDSDARMMALLTKSKKLQEEIRRLRKELAAQER